MTIIPRETINFLSDLLVIATLTTGTLAFVFKSWISELIKTRFSKAVSQELDSYRHELNRELETYKTSLIRDLEQYKANIDIQRTIAIKMADEKLRALRELISSFDSYAMVVGLCAVLSEDQRLLKINDAFDAQDRFSISLHESLIFLPMELNLEISNSNTQLANILNIKETISADDQRLQDLRNQCAVIHHKLRDQIFRPPPPLKTEQLT